MNTYTRVYASKREQTTILFTSAYTHALEHFNFCIHSSVEYNSSPVLTQSRSPRMQGMYMVVTRQPHDVAPRR